MRYFRISPKKTYPDWNLPRCYLQWIFPVPSVQRIYLSLKNNHGYTGSIRTVYRICKEHHLLIHRKRSPKSITKADKTAEKSENLIAQNFQADKPNEKWLTDITEIPCQDGKVYLAPVLDCYDGMIVAFSMADHMKASLCVDAFEQACRKERCRGILLHSDRGSQIPAENFELYWLNMVQYKV